jgi:hypothetical protein
LERHGLFQAGNIRNADESRRWQEKICPFHCIWVF